MIRNTVIFLKSFPLKVIGWKLKCKIFKIKMPGISQWQQLFENKAGIEIGGPSAVFESSGFLPIYPIISNLDGVNFSSSTMWENKIFEGQIYTYGNKKGFQFISEGSSLSNIKDGQYDFVLSCNNLEHIANPISAIFEWKRIIKNNGLILLILPNKLNNFDHRRPYTTLEHLITDYKNNATEEDLTHLEEILKLHDLSRDPRAGDFENFKRRSLDNIHNRGLHHHVFNQQLLKDVLEYCGMKTLLQHTTYTDLYIVAVKS